MAVRVLCRPAIRVNSFERWRKSCSKVYNAQEKPKEDAGNEKEQKNTVLCQEMLSKMDYRPPYNHSPRLLKKSCGKLHPRKPLMELPLVHSTIFWQKNNSYCMTFSRRFSDLKPSFLDVALIKAAELYKHPPTSHKHHMDFGLASRDFHKSRPEYASISLDLTRRPEPVDWVELQPVLQTIFASAAMLKPSDVPQFFFELSRVQPQKLHLLKSDQRFIGFLRNSAQHLRDLPTSKLFEVLESLVWLQVSPFQKIFRPYEAELVRRAKEMTLHELLLTADLCRCIGKSVPQLMAQLCSSIKLQCDEIGIAEMVQLLFLTGEARFMPEYLIHPFEKLLMSKVHQLHPEEVSAVCLGLFKSQTPISEKVVNSVVDQACSFARDMSDFGIVNVFKYLRYSHLTHRKWFGVMAQEVPRRADNMHIQGLMHVALACSSLHYRDDEILSAIAERVPSLAPSCRSKDACKLLWAFGTLQFTPTRSQKLYDSLIESLRQRRREFEQYPEHLLTGLLGLAFVSHFPEDLIAFALSPKFINMVQKNSQMDFEKDLLTLDGVVGVELPEWTGPRLSSDMKEKVAEMLWTFAQSDLCQRVEVIEAEHTLQDLLGGEQFVRKRMILPYTRSIDLEIQLDSTGAPIPFGAQGSAAKPPVQKDLNKLKTGVTVTDGLLAQLINSKTSSPSSSKIKPTSLKTLLPDEAGKVSESVLDLTSDLEGKSMQHSIKPTATPSSNQPTKVAIQITNRNHYCSRTEQLYGLHAMKRRHLRMIGYKVVEVDYRMWIPMLRKSKTERKAYLHCLIYDSL